jgi:hypothetical protein
MAAEANDWASKHQVPIADIDPFTEFETDLGELRDFAKTELLMQGYTGSIGEGDAANGDVKSQVF